MSQRAGTGSASRGSPKMIACLPTSNTLLGAMTRKERFLTALRVAQPDRVPMFDFLFQQPMYEALIGRRPESYNGRDAMACALALNHDGVWLPFGGFSGYKPKFLRDNVYQDEWGTTYQKDAASWPIDAPTTPSTTASRWRTCWPYREPAANRASAYTGRPGLK
jgi:hypothetical protein